MNLKEAKEYLQNNGFAVQRLNECGSSGCGGSGCSGYSRARTSCYSYIFAKSSLINMHL